jgi:dTDP-4-dehydrorhamnose reductase
VTEILLIGRTGQVGRELEPILPTAGNVVALGRGQIELTDPDSIRSAIRSHAPHVIVNAAGYTAVDKAESQAELAMKVNAVAAGVLAEEAKRCRALLVHYSTDYVFDGTKAAPYVEEDAPNPLNTYGKTKLEGERAIAAVGGDYLILRTSWMYSGQPPNFVLTMLDLARERGEISVVDDQVGSPTWARALAEATVALLRRPDRVRDNPGIYHLSAQGYATRFEFAQRIFEYARELAPQTSRSPLLRRIRSAEFPLPAARPLNAATSKEKVGRVFGIEMQPWEHALRRFLEERFAHTAEPKRAGG